MPNIHPAHNDSSEQPIPLKEIRESKCVNCRCSYAVNALITYTRLHNKKVLWWHRREHSKIEDPCVYKRPYIASHVRLKPLQREQDSLRDKIKIEHDKFLEENKELIKKLKWEKRREYYLQNHEKIRAQNQASRLRRQQKSLRQSRSQPTTPLSNDQLE